MPIKAVSFDFWNTLYTEDDGGFVFYGDRRLTLLAKALTPCGSFELEKIRHACRIEGERQYDIWRYEHRTPSVGERLDCILSHLQADLSATTRSQLIAAFEEGILEKPPRLIPGATYALQRLSSRYRLGIISDVGFSPGRVLREILRRSGVLEAFDSLVFSDEAGRSKPHHSVFQRTASALDAGPGEIVHIGDLEHTDVIGAKRAGYIAIRFTGVTPLDDGEATAADHISSDLETLPALIDSISGG